MKKGGKSHARFGWAYVFGMTGVAVTSIIMALMRLLLDQNLSELQRDFSIFLLMIAIFTASAVWTGLQVLAWKGPKVPHRRLFDVAVTSLRIVSSALVSYYGFSRGNPLLSYFSLVPFVTGLLELKYWLSPSDDGMHWWFQHMSSMFTACIATVTAFAVTAVPRLLGTSSSNIVLWSSPALILLPILISMRHHYRKRFPLPKR